jgi:hypothetical protein
MDTVLAVYEGCEGAELACDDDAVVTRSAVVVDLSRGDEVVVVVAAKGRSGSAVVNVTEVPASEGDCGDGADDDLDLLVDCEDTDCSADPACGGETRCGDLVDDDGDGLIDCLDPECSGRATCATCADYKLPSMAPLVGIVGTTTGYLDDDAGSCGGSTGEDVSLEWTAPADGYYTFDTTGSAIDTVLFGRYSTCAGLEVACNDDISAIDRDSSFTGYLYAGEVLILTVDSYSASGMFTFSVY